MNKKTYILKKDCPNICKEIGDCYNNEYSESIEELLKKGVIEEEEEEEEEEEPKNKMKYLKDVLKKKKPKNTERPEVVKTFTATTTPKKKNIFRVTYRLKASKPLVGEIIFKTIKERWEINFAKEIAKYWEKNKKDLKLDEILLISQIS